jgi:hypothetical protein
MCHPDIQISHLGEALDGARRWGAAGSKRSSPRSPQLSFTPTKTTNFFPRVTPVSIRLEQLDMSCQDHLMASRYRQISLTTEYAEILPPSTLGALWLP